MLAVAGAPFAATAMSASPPQRVCFHEFSGWAVFEGIVSAHQPAATAVEHRAATKKVRIAKTRHDRTGSHLRAAQLMLKHAAPSKRPAVRKKVKSALRTVRITRTRLVGAQAARRATRARIHARYVIAVTGGRSGSGTLSSRTYQYDTPCNYTHQTGKPLDDKARVKLNVVITDKVAVSSVTRQLPTAGAHVTVTLSGLTNLSRRGIAAGRVRAFANWSR